MAHLRFLAGKLVYRAALFEVDATKLPTKIREAQEAVREALEALTGTATGAEYQALYDALNALADLQRMSESGMRESTKGEVLKNETPVRS